MWGQATSGKKKVRKAIYVESSKDEVGGGCYRCLCWRIKDETAGLVLEKWKAK